MTKETEKNEKPAKRRYLSYTELRKIEDTLRPLLEVEDVAGEKYCTYLPNWTDTKAAERVRAIHGIQCSAAQVSYLRRQVFGELRTSSSGLPTAELRRINERIALLEARIATLEELIAD